MDLNGEELLMKGRWQGGGQSGEQGGGNTMREHFQNYEAI